MEYKDYYKILGVEKNASVDEIKKQYRRLARKYHPDVSRETDAEEKFKQVREAYEVLKNPEKRQAYDQVGQGWQAGQSFTPPPGWQFNQAGADAGAEEAFNTAGFSEFFENLFGQRAYTQHHRGTRRSQRGQDQHAKISLSLQEAFTGTERTLQLEQPEIDPATGQVHVRTQSLRVKIPAGATQGQQIRLAKQGGKGLGDGVNGDLYLEIQLLKNPLYSVQHRDVYLNLPVTPWEAALGAKVKVPTLAGKVELAIPPNSQSGKKLRLKGRGLPGTPPGDQYVVLVVYAPEAKTEEQRQLYEKMAQEMHYDPRKELME